MSPQLNESQLSEFAKTVQVAATHILEGLHRSPHGGEGVEFHSVTPYAQGEDIRRLDWKRLASTEKYYIRRFQKEHQSGWSLLIDKSASMQYGDKAKHAHHLAACFAYLARTWGDPWRIYPSIEYSLEDAFEALSEGNVGVLPEDFSKIETQAKSRLVVFSDFFYDQDFLTKALEYWMDDFDSVYFLQILDPKEYHFEFKDVLEFRDMESSDKIILDSKMVRKKYFKELNQVQVHLEDLSKKSEGFLLPVIADEKDLTKQMQEFFERL